MHYDALTGLLNSIGIQNAVDDLIQFSQIRNRRIALLYINLANFKAINQAFGLEFGDRVLSEVAHALKLNTRQSDDCDRLVMDRFLVSLLGFNDTKSVEFTANKILEAIHNITQVENQSINLDASIGISLYPEDGKTYNSLCKRAEHAMHNAQISENTYSNFFSSFVLSEVPDDFFMVKELNQAIDKHQMHLEFQPILKVSDLSINKAEALLRWQHPDLGFISPEIFIPLAEKYGLIRSLTKWVIKESLKQLKSWIEKYGVDFQIAINLSSHDFHDFDECINNVRDSMHQTGLFGHNICFEITEHSLIGNSATTEKILHAMRTMGIQVALDDFGTGYSSLDYLKRYPVNILKIDKTFVSSLESNEIEQHLCDGIIQIAKKLGLKVVAEGIETQKQAKILKAFGSDYFQGFHYSKPLKVDDFEAFIQEHQARLQTLETTETKAN